MPARESTAAPRSVVVITVSYRSAEPVEASLRALATERERERKNGVEISAVIVDNASGDSPAIARAIESEGWASWVTLITSERNGGFAYGNNVGMSSAYASGAFRTTSCSSIPMRRCGRTRSASWFASWSVSPEPAPPARASRTRTA